MWVERMTVTFDPIELRRLKAIPLGRVEAGDELVHDNELRVE
jgi:hypothetical protein